MRNSYKPSCINFINFTGILSSVPKSESTYFTFCTSLSVNEDRNSW